MARPRKIKSETYKGIKLKFTKLHKDFVGVQAPARTSQYIGIGKGKLRAFDDAKDSIDKFKHWHPKKKR